jgi:hypothetical protein
MSGILGVGTGLLQGSAGSLISGVSQAFPAVMQQTGLGGLLAFIRQPRSIGTIIPDVTIEENFEDRLAVTSHPVATGSPIQDHAYREPRQCTMRIGFTNANPVGGAVSGLLSGGSGLLGSSGGGLLSGDIAGGLTGAANGLISSALEQRAQDMYKKLLDLQFTEAASFASTGPQAGTPNQQSKTGTVIPFQLTAGKRTYPSMVITSISVRNDHRTEYACILEVRMQEVMFVSASLSSQPSGDNQGKPSQTQSPDKTGETQPTGETTLHSGFGFLGKVPGFLGDLISGITGNP